MKTLVLIIDTQTGRHTKQCRQLWTLSDKLCETLSVINSSLFQQISYMNFFQSLNKDNVSVCPSVPHTTGKFRHHSSQRTVVS